jgi:nucleotide-binding universal stress UspA family protein
MIAKSIGNPGRNDSMIKRILVGIGGTPFTAVAIDRAVELAAAHGAGLTGITIADPDRECRLGPVPPGAGIYAKRMCENRLAVTKPAVATAIAQFEEQCRQHDIQFQVIWETGNTFERIIGHARYHDLTIVGLRSLFEYQLADEPEKDILRLLSNGVRPILAVSNRKRTIGKVLVAYTGSVTSASAMQQFVQYKLWPEATLEIVSFGSGGPAVEKMLMEAEHYCHSHGFSVSTHIVQGAARNRMIPYAEQSDADMIVMGNSIRRIWLAKMMGDTTLHVMSQAQCPLFLSM